MSGPLLIVAHEATRTGSPRVLLELLRYSTPLLDVPVAVELLADGPLGPELRSFATTDRYREAPRAVIVNSAAAAPVIDRIGPGTPTLLYVHEEGDALAVLPPAARSAITRFDRVLCVSSRSHDDLLALGVDDHRIEVLAPVVRLHQAPAPRPARPPLVLGCGEAGWRKGADLFIDVARRMSDVGEARFQWAGRRPRAFARVLDNDTRAAKMDTHIEWLGEVTDVAPLFGAATLLLMTSREDPRPLVPLEAAPFGVATAGFSIGGISDLASAGAAVAVPYPDTVALAAAAADLLRDDEHRIAVSTSAARLAHAHHSIDVVGPRFVAAVTDMLEN